MEKTNQSIIRLDMESLEAEKPLSTLGSAIKKAEIKSFTEGDVLEALGDLKKDFERAKNIDSNNAVEAFRFVGAERMWKTMNNLPENRTPKSVKIPMEDIYKLNRVLDNME